MWKIAIGAVVALAGLSLLYPFMWFSTEFHARVVDGVTGQPIPGAIVLANWELIGGFEPNPTGELVIAETVTAADGVFHIPAWGPRFAFGLGSLQKGAPNIRILSRGYYPLTMDNRPGRKNIEDYGPSGMIIGFYLQGQDLKLKPQDADLVGYERALNYLALDLSFIYFGRDCEWRSAPRTLAFVDRLVGELSKQNRTSNLRPVWQLGEQAHCGGPSPRDFVREHSK